MINSVDKAMAKSMFELLFMIIENIFIRIHKTSVFLLTKADFNSILKYIYFLIQVFNVTKWTVSLLS